VARQLKKAGWKDPRPLLGGWAALLEAGFPVENIDAA
jgi:hypothetical protein